MRRNICVLYGKVNEMRKRDLRGEVIWRGKDVDIE
jgi:hypothetical protein